MARAIAVIGVSVSTPVQECIMKPPQEFDVGQRVSVRVNDRNRTARTGEVREVMWHSKDVCYNYYLLVDGKKVSKRYHAIDLIAEDR